MSCLNTSLFFFFTFVFVLFSFGQDTYADTLNCEGGTPTFIVDLSSNIDSLWVSDPVEREGECCMAADDNCVQFTVTLPEEAGGIIFSIPDGCGAVPGGALFYQIDCGPVTSVGTPLCLDGVGPFVITFCKPGSNENCFAIEAFSDPGGSTDITITDACVDSISVAGLVESSITWTSIAPGIPGEYDGLLSCAIGCDSVAVTTIPGITYPSTIRYRVCGTAIGGCATTSFCDTVQVTIVPDLDVEILPYAPSICFGEVGIDITANPIGGMAPYTYLWNTGETTLSILAGVGTYFVEIMDSTGCTIGMDTVEVTSYLEIIEANAGTDITVCGTSIPAVELDGTILGATTAGWVGGDGIYLPDSSALNAIYTPTSEEIATGFVALILVTTDNGSCPGDQDTVLLNFTNFNSFISADIIDVDCFGESTGSIDLNVLGGALPLSYLWDTGDLTEDLTGLSLGTYAVIATDTNGCTGTFSGVINEPQALELAFNTTDVTCFGSMDGEIDATVTGGVAPYTYNWLTGETIEDLTGVDANSYLLTLTDWNGCEIELETTIIQPPEIEILAEITDVSCNGLSDGIAEVEATGGVIGYTFEWVSGELTNIINGLPTGENSVTVTDASGCQNSLTVNIDEPNLFELAAEITNTSCFGASDGEINLIPVGGSPSFSYLWGEGQTTEDLVELSLGTYSVIATDANGCEATLAVDVNEPLTSAVAMSVEDVSCFDGEDGSIDATPFGGTAPFTFEWNTGEITESITDIVIGSYSVTVTDANGCSATGLSTVDEPTALELNITSIDESCIDAGDGSADLTTVGGVAAYSYVWSVGDLTEDITGLLSGDYSVVVTDANGCMEEASIIINSPIEFSAGNDTTTMVCSNDGLLNLNGLLSATTLGEWSELTFSGQFNITTGILDLTELPEGDYIFNYLIPSFTPCTDVLSTITVTVNPLPNVNFTVDKVMGCSELLVRFSNLTDLLGGGCIWDIGDGMVLEGCEDFSHLYASPGDFDVSLTVTSVNGCTNTLSVDDFISVATSPTAEFLFAPEVITIENTVVLFSNYSMNSDTYEWDFGDGSSVDTDLNPNHNFPDTEAAEYQVELIAYNNAGCSDTTWQLIPVQDALVVYVPNVFTPDGNSFNETFTPIISGGVDVNSYHLTIFNRWGEIIFESFDFNYGWNGGYGDKGLVKDDVYIWRMEFKETMSDKRHDINGHVTVLK